MDASISPILEALQRQSDVDGVKQIFADFVALYGFDNFVVANLPGDGSNKAPFVHTFGWPAEWVERYSQRGYIRFDPVARHSFSTTLPFDWVEAPHDPVTDPEAEQVMIEAGQFGMNNGFCVPVHLEDGARGLVSLSGPTGHLDEQRRLQLHLVSFYVHGRLRMLNTIFQPRLSATLTAREGQIVQWVASGKTTAEIAIISGLSERTVNQHCENAQRRLGTNNRVHTVVEAIRHRLITL